MTARAVVPAPSLPSPAEAQTLIDAHSRSDLAGRRRSCGQDTPCHSRELGHAGFRAAGLLPQRRPGIDRGASTKPFDAFSLS